MKFKIYSTDRKIYNHPLIYANEVIDNIEYVLPDEYRNYEYKTKTLTVFKKGSNEYNNAFLFPYIERLISYAHKVEGDKFSDVVVTENKITYKHHHIESFINLESLEELINFRNEIKQEIIITSDNILEIYDGYRE